jgi:hypothetical protein
MNNKRKMKKKKRICSPNLLKRRGPYENLAEGSLGLPPGAKNRPGKAEVASEGGKIGSNQPRL